MSYDNFAVIFAGGSGKRMNTKSRPKQFLEFRGKPIIIYTLELFDNHPAVDGIVVACLREYWSRFSGKDMFKYLLGRCRLYGLFPLFLAIYRRQGSYKKHRHVK